MAGAAIPGRLTTGAARLVWRPARVLATRTETPRVRTLALEVPDWPGHRPGQHLDLRLTAEDGYQAQRSYSIASAPGADHVELTVERLDDGEVSPYLVDVVRREDRIEVRGPIGGYFVWEPQDARPLALVAGGSGVVPLMAMLRHRDRVGSRVPAALLYSARSAEELIYRRELEAMIAADPELAVRLTLTRAWPDGWAGYRHRVDQVMLREALPPPEAAPRVYVCGPTPMVETVATLLVELGYPAEGVRTERFGPSGGGGA